jgi:hypothetical protein
MNTNFSQQRNRSLTAIAIAFTALTFHSFASEAKPSINAWSGDWLTGKTLSLVSDRRIENLRFNSGGSIAATIGTQGGSVTGPLLNWHIKNSKLVIGDSKVYESLIFISYDGTKVKAKRITGELAEYVVTNK